MLRSCVLVRHVPLQMAPTASDFTEQDELNEKPAAPAEAPAAEE